MGTALMIIGAFAALGIGVWLGMPGRYSQSAEDIDRIMEAGGGRRRKVKRMFTPLAWINRHVSSKALHKTRGGFKVEPPDER